MAIRNPVIFDRALGEWQPTPKVNAFVIFQAPPPPANPVIPIVKGQWIGDETPPLIGTAPRYLPFPYIDSSLFPAYPAINFGYGRYIMAQSEAFIVPRHLPFPYRRVVLATSGYIVMFRRRRK